MSKSKDSKKPHAHPLYDFLPLRCPKCIEIQKVSQIFENAYQLLYHLTTVHENEQLTTSNISVHEIKLAISGVVTAQQWKMLINYPKTETKYRRIRL